MTGASTGGRLICTTDGVSIIAGGGGGGGDGGDGGDGGGVGDAGGGVGQSSSMSPSWKSIRSP